MRISDIPSAWMKMDIEKLKEVKERYKLANDIEKEAQREQAMAKELEKQQASTQMEAMKDTIPFLGQ